MVNEGGLKPSLPGSLSRVAVRVARPKQDCLLPICFVIFACLLD